MTRILRAVSAAITLLLPAVAAAQDTPRIGLVMGYPAQVGVLWTVAARLAIRPEVNWTRTTTETVSTATVFNGTGVTTTSVTTTSHSNAAFRSCDCGSGPTCAFLCGTNDDAVALAASLAGAGVCRSTRVVHGPVTGARVVEPGSAR